MWSILFFTDRSIVILALVSYFNRKYILLVKTSSSSGVFPAVLADEVWGYEASFLSSDRQCHTNEDCLMSRTLLLTVNT